MALVLRWSEPALTMRAGDGSWAPFADIVNESDAAAEVSGAAAASAVLLRADGTCVTAASSVMAIPAVLVRFHLEPQQSRAMRVVLGLTPDDMAALPAGRYRISGVSWQSLTAPDIELDIQP